MKRFNTLREIKSSLVRGDIVKIARKTGYDVSHVYRVISGECQANLEILNEASSLLRSREKAI